MKPEVTHERIPTLEELVAQITKTNRYEETDWGPEREKEDVEWKGRVNVAKQHRNRLNKAGRQNQL